MRNEPLEIRSPAGVTARASALRSIRVISEGRPGHENQSVGLAEALARRTGADLEVIQIPPRGWLWQRCAAGSRLTDQRPDLIIGAGHKVHLPMIHAARKFGANTVVIMKPTWPLRLFDLCILPQHDAVPICAGGKIIRVFGALNRLLEGIPAKQSRGLILIGGPSKAHGFDLAATVANVGLIVSARPELHWTLSDSRRTPPEFLAELCRRNIPCEIFSNDLTPRNWLPQQLMAAEEAWVTEDSISMIFESVTAGARTGILPVPIRKSNADPVRAVRELSKEGYVTDLQTWLREGRRLPAPKPLHETARCAELILSTLYP